MTLDADDIQLLRELIRECLANPEPQPTKHEQIRAMARDPELARQLFKKNRKPQQRRER